VFAGLAWVQACLYRDLYRDQSQFGGPDSIQDATEVADKGRDEGSRPGQHTCGYSNAPPNPGLRGLWPG
jgi:hypothetical protein